MAEKKEKTKVKVVPKPAPQVDVDTENKFVSTILDAATTSSLDIGKLESFTNVAQTRDALYSTIDTMCMDSTLAAVLETYAEDVVETNEDGRSVWCQSNDANVANYVTYLLDSLQVEKYIYKWAVKLIKYGDLYIRLYKDSDYRKDPIFEEDDGDSKESLREDVNLKISNKDDHYAHYVEVCDNPAEIFELTNNGKTMGFIEAPINMIRPFGNADTAAFNFIRYRLNRRDVNVYAATDFAHACLEDTSSRVAERVNIFLTNSDLDPEHEVDFTYKVRRGQSLFNNVFKVWRELTLLENSILLSRLTKSAIVRILNVEVGDMPKEQVTNFIERLKSKIEQKSALNTDQSLTNYTDPGPIENVIYIPTHEGAGTITQNTMGGDVDPKSLVDLDWFNNKLFGALRVPKQYFGWTDDSAGFNGGTSLSIISSRYGKAVKRIQKTLCECITDIINLYLLDAGYSSYINRFEIRMQAPITQEDIDRRENNETKVRYIGDLMTQLNEVEEPAARLKILKILLLKIINDNEITEIIEDQIKKLEEEGVQTPTEEGGEQGQEPVFGGEPEPLRTTPFEEEGFEEVVPEEEIGTETETTSEEEVERLPSPNELDLDMTQNI